MAVVGRLPPPYGGVTVHITRLARLLVKCGIPYRIYDTDGRSDPDRHAVAGGNTPLWLLKFLVTVPEAGVHLHTNNVKTIMLAAAVLPWRKKRLLVSLHSEAPMRWYRGAGLARQRFWRWCVNRCHHVLAASQPLDAWLEELGLPTERRSVIPAFLPPSDAEMAVGDLAPEVTKFLDDHTPVIGSQGFFGYFLDGRHLYSFDMIHDLLLALRRRFPKLGVYTLISGTYEEDHRQRILAARARSGLDGSWIFLSGVANTVSLYSRTDLYLRPTVTDGDSVSVRECLFLGTPVVASDAVPRPAGCVLFRNRDRADMTAKVEGVLMNLEAQRQTLQQSRSDPSSARIREIYRSTLDLSDH
jgi:glycosyltransferase involved in cell wall biosynthesis